MLWTAFLVGLIGSTHCIGMCGPLLLAVPVQKAENWIYYHLGRILMYGLLGLMMGIIGKGLWMAGIQNQISIVLGILMIIGGLFTGMNRTFVQHGYYQKFLFWLKSKMNILLRKKGGWPIFLLGSLNGLLPCGLVYLALAGAFSSTYVLEGSLYMILFGLGTFPLNGAISFTGKIIQGKWRAVLQKISPILWVMFGLFLVIRGFQIELPDSFRLNPTIQEAPMCH